MFSGLHFQWMMLISLFGMVGCLQWSEINASGFIEQHVSLWRALVQKHTGNYCGKNQCPERNDVFHIALLRSRGLHSINYSNQNKHMLIEQRKRYNGVMQ